MGIFDFLNKEKAARKDAEQKDIADKTNNLLKHFGYDDIDRKLSLYKSVVADEAVMANIKKTIGQPLESEKNYRKEEKQKVVEKRLTSLSRVTALYEASDALAKGDASKMMMLNLDDQASYEAVMRHPNKEFDQELLGKIRMQLIYDLSTRSKQNKSPNKKADENRIYSEGQKAALNFAAANNIRKCRDALEIFQKEYQGYHLSLKDLLKNERNKGDFVAPYMAAVLSLPELKYPHSEISELYDLQDEQRQQVFESMKRDINYNSKQQAEMLVSYAGNTNPKDRVRGTISQANVIGMLVASNNFDMLNKNTTDRLGERATGDFYNTMLMHLNSATKFGSHALEQIMPNLATFDKFIAGYNAYNLATNKAVEQATYESVFKTGFGDCVFAKATLAGLIYEERLKDQYDPEQELSAEMENDLTIINNLAYGVMSNWRFQSQEGSGAIDVFKRLIILETGVSPAQDIKGTFKENAGLPNFSGRGWNTLMLLKKQNKDAAPVVDHITMQLAKEYDDAELGPNNAKVQALSGKKDGDQPKP